MRVSNNNSDENFDFVEYNDNLLEHSSSGPDYGNSESGSLAWDEIHSKEYLDFVSEISKKIIKNRVRLF